MIKVEFDTEIFKDRLHYYFTNIHTLCSKSSNNYIGYSETTLYKALRSGVMSKDVYDAIMEKYDISDCVINFIYPEEEKIREIRRLRSENRELRLKIKNLENENRLLNKYNKMSDFDE